MFNLDLPFEVQAVARFEANKLIIGDCAPFTEVEFSSHGAYIRRTGKKTPIKGIQLECDEFQYKNSVEYAFVYFDFVNKYTLDSVGKTVQSQLNQKGITVKSIETDFRVITTEEKLIIKDACMVKIVFEVIEEFINDCNGLVCVC